MKQFIVMVEEEAKSIVKELINERRPEIKSEIESQLTTKRWAKMASQAVISGIENAHMSLSVQFKTSETF